MNNFTYLSDIDSRAATEAEQISDIETVKWRNLFDVISIILLILYLAFIPAGIVGLSLVTASLLIKLIATNNTTRGIYMLYFGIITLGMISIAFGYPGIGGKVGLVIGILIILFTTNLSNTLYNLKAPLLWMMWISLLLLVFYFNGPMTPYCTHKLINTVINGVLFLIIFYNIFNNRSVEWFHLGQLGILSSFVFLAAGLMITPELKPNSILDIGVIRITFEMLQSSNFDMIEMQNTISYLASMGMILIYAASPDRALSRFSIIKLLIYIFFEAVILAWSSARLPIVSIVIAGLLIIFMKPLFKKRYRIMSLMLIGLFTIFITMGLLNELNFIQNILNPSNTLTARFNRELNWLSGYDRFIEKPWVGYGLGGYFIDGLSHPGEGTYAHNLFLELLSETGIIGTILIIWPIFFWRQLFSKAAFFLRAQNGGLIFPILIMFYLQSMISYDLQSSIALFSIIGIMAASIMRPQKVMV